MSDPVDLVDLTPLIDQIFFGTMNPEEDAAGGIMTALELTEDQVVEDDDAGERPSGLFVTYRILDSGKALYGQAIEDYVSIELDPDEAPDEVPEDEEGEEGGEEGGEGEEEPPMGSALLRYNNARIVGLRIAVHAPAAGYTDLAVLSLARRAQRHLASVTNNELLLLGLDAYVVDPGIVRNATTILNEQIERIFAFDASLVVGETYTVPIKTFETVTLSFQQGVDGEEEEREI